MKHNLFRIVSTIVLAVCLLLCVPSSMAKYATSGNILVPVKKVVLKDFWYTNSSAIFSVAKDTSSQEGYYAVLIKGGNGGDGVKHSFSTTSGSVAGGNGGLMLGYIYLTASDSLVVKIGTAGGNAGTSAYGAAGTNGTDMAKGYRGKCLSSDDTKFIIDIFNNDYSAGSGAGTILYKNSVSQSNLMMIAGGGGAAASVNTNVSSKVPGEGGAGGGNYNGPVTSYTDVSSPSTGKVYPGGNGIGSTWSKKSTTYHTNGYGGSVSGGAGGTCGDYTYWLGIAPYTFSQKTAGSGSAYSTSANGGNGGAGIYLSGPGGGGYAGGGGGAGFGVDRSAAGGGGGSSYINTTAMTEFSSTAADKYSLLLGKTNGACSGTQANGFAIVYYLGKDKPNG